MSRPIEAAPDARATIIDALLTGAPGDGDTFKELADRITALEEVSDGGGAGPLVYRATLTQSGTSAPVANILENTLGAIPVWSRIGTGDYLLTLNGAFPVNKTLIETQQISSQNPNMPFRVIIATDPNVIELQCLDGDSLIDGSAISVLVYP